MLVIRLKRIGRGNHAMFRVIVQDSRQSPKSGKVVASLGSYDPHTKQVVLDTEQAQIYLKNGAHPSERVARLLKEQSVKLPVWVALADKKSGAIRNAEKLRRNRPAEAEAPAKPVEEEATAETTAESTDVEAAPAPDVEAADAPPTEAETTESAEGPVAVENKPAETTVAEEQ